MIGKALIPTVDAPDLDAVADATAAVATVYCDPANDVTLPAPDPARVMAWPPTDVTTVTA